MGLVPLVSTSDNKLRSLVSNVNNKLPQVQAIRRFLHGHVQVKLDGFCRDTLGRQVILISTTATHSSRVQMNLKQWLYKGGRPNRLATIVNRFWAVVHALGIAPNYLVTLEVRGRRSGRTVSLPLVMVVADGERYLVSMLGTNVDWVRNVNAAGGNVTLRHGRREQVWLEEVPADRRAPVLKAYLKLAPGARAHLPIQKDAPLSEFERIASQFPVFRVVSRSVDPSTPPKPP